MNIRKVFALAIFPFLLAGCTTNENVIDRSTQQKSVEGYISKRYVNDYDYADYCMFKPNNTHMLIDTSMKESIDYQNEYYSAVSVSDVVYKKTEDIDKAEYSTYQLQDNEYNLIENNVTSAEKGVATYHWVMTANEKGKTEGVAEIDGTYSKDLTILFVEGEYFVYLTVH